MLPNFLDLILILSNIIIVAKNLISKILAGILGIGISCYFIEGVNYDGKITTILFVGLILGLINFFIRPIIEKITFPIRILTLNLFTLVIIMLMVFCLDVLFPENRFGIQGLKPLFFSSLIVWGLDILFSFSS